MLSIIFILGTFLIDIGVVIVYLRVPSEVVRLRKPFVVIEVLDIERKLFIGISFIE